MSPIKEIWFNTGKCIDYFLVKGNRKPYLEELVWIQTFAFGILSFLESRNPFYLIASPAITVLLLRFFFPWLLQKTGMLMNGHGTREDLKLIVSLASIPYLLSLFYIFIAIVIPGKRDYQYGVIEILIWVFSWRILIIGVAKVQRISYVLALMNIAIPASLIAILYLILRY